MTETELMALLRQKFGKAKRVGRAGYIYIPCPTCKASQRKKNKRFLIPPSYHLTNCWVCDQAISTQVLLGSSSFEPIERTGVPYVKTEHPLASILPCRKTIPINQLSRDHLAVKFLSKDFLFELDRYYNEFGIVYCPPDGGQILSSSPFVSSAERLIFPVTFNKKLIGWQMRSIPGTIYGDRPDVVRYYHLFNKGNYLYNYDNAIQYRVVVVVEGVKKTLKYENAVATLGKGVSQTQVELLCMGWEHIVLLLDGEEEAREKAAEIEEGLRLQGKKVTNINPMEFGYASPDEMPQDVAREIVATKLM